MANKKQEEIINHLLSVGFFYQGSEIYNGLANSWDCGPNGVLLKNNLKKIWWDYFVTKKENYVGIDSNIILNSDVWKASGHISLFSDPLIDCINCKLRFRADKLILENSDKYSINEQTSFDELEKIINELRIKCVNCNSFSWSKIRKFNLLFETSIGTIENEKSKVYLRPETAQGIFINFKNVLRTSRKKLPFAICQIGKSFRNEITPSNFIFRTREFEQMEIEYFNSGNNSENDFEDIVNDINNFLINVIGINPNNIKKYDYDKNELAHYSRRTIDFLYNFPHGWTELWGIADRGTFDLNAHQELSKKDLFYLDPENNKKILASVIEPSVGVERLMYALIVDAYNVEQLENENRIVMKFKKELCPYLCAVLPLNNKLNEQAHKIYLDLISNNISCSYDISGSIGKRYRRQDAIGTYWCITYDFDSLNDNCVTIRDRDSMKQERIPVKELLDFIRN